jgi:hypothetical protein
MIACGASLAILSPAVPAYAQIIGRPRVHQCSPHQELYSTSSKDIPPVLAAAMTGDGAALEFRTCRDGEGSVHYFVREKLPNYSGVCRISEKEIFPGKATDEAFFNTPSAPSLARALKGWTEKPPLSWRARYRSDATEMALVHDGPCLNSSVANYIAVSGVTDGMMKNVMGAWSRAVGSPGAFDRAFASVELRRGATADDKRKLRAAALAGKLRFGDISCTDRDCAASIAALTLYVHFDVGARGVVFTALSPIYQT